MAATPKRLGKGQLSTASSTLYTVPTGTTTLVKAVTLCNTTSAPLGVTLSFAGTAVIFSHSIKGYDTITIPFIDQIITAGETITGSAGAVGVNFYISGKEVT